MQWKVVVNMKVQARINFYDIENNKQFRTKSEQVEVSESQTKTEKRKASYDISFLENPKNRMYFLDWVIGNNFESLYVEYSLLIEVRVFLPRQDKIFTFAILITDLFFVIIKKVNLH